MGTGRICALTPSDIAVERLVCFLGGGFRDGEGDAQDGIGAQIGFIGRAVQVDHQPVEVDLVEDVFPEEGFPDGFFHVAAGAQDAFPQEAGLVAVAQFDGLVFAGRCPGGYGGAADKSVFGHYFYFDGRVAAGVEYFPCAYI